MRVNFLIAFEYAIVNSNLIEVTMDALYYLTGVIITLGLPIFGIGIIAALIKPHLVNNRRVIKNPLSRKKIAGVGVTTLLVSFISLSTVLAATEPASIKQERQAREAAQALQLQQEAEAKKRAEEEARKREEQANKPVIKTETKTEVIAFESIKKNDNTLPQGRETVSVAGVNGERTITYEVTYVKGEETARKKVSTKVTKKAVNKVTLVGTYIAPTPRSTPSPAPQTSYSEGVVKMSRTSICHAPGTTYYSQTIHYTSYPSLSSCLAAGGRMPKR